MQNAKVACAHTLPKIHNEYIRFHSMIDTTSRYKNIGSFLTQLLNPLFQNDFVIKDSLDAANKICEIPTDLFNKGQVFTSIEIENLFPNIPLERTINIILDCVFNKKLVTTQLKKRTLKRYSKILVAKRSSLQITSCMNRLMVLAWEVPSVPCLQI